MNTKGLLEKLQSADEAAKKRYVVIASAVVMVVVLWLWLGYFNNLITRESPAVAANQPSFFTTMKRGAGIVYQGFIDAIGGFGKALTSPKTYEIKN